MNETLFTPSTLFDELGCSGNRWTLRTTALASLNQNQRCCDFPAAPDFSRDSTEDNRPKKPISVEVFLERAGPAVAAIHRSLLVTASQAETVDDVVELAARARKELSSCAIQSTLLAAHPALEEAVRIHTEANDETEYSSLMALVALTENVDFMRNLKPLCSDSIVCLVRTLQGAYAARGIIISEARKRYGCRSENRAIAEWNLASADEDQITCSGEAATSIEKPWFAGAHLRGKPDGYFASTGEVVEIKFRTKKFCIGGLLRDSERLQVHAYMFMTGTTRCTLLEGICRRGSILLRHTQINFDAGYWHQITARAMKLVQFRTQIGIHVWFRSAFFAMSTENQARMIESIFYQSDREESAATSTLKRSRENDENFVDLVTP